MSDFIYASTPQKKGKCKKAIENIYLTSPPVVKEIHGTWGSLAFSENLYNGFKHYETVNHICIVIGGPVLCFKSNDFLANSDSNEGTRSIYDRWIKGVIKWDEDLSGPFTILIVDKTNLEITCVTDLMSFIPVYKFYEAGILSISTHVDALAEVFEQQQNIDIVSEVDFILHGIITYPYTIYNHIRQLPPAAEIYFLESYNKTKVAHYWYPEENYKYTSMNEAAKNLREALNNYVESINNNVENTAQFISGGEDSRLLAFLLSSKKTKDSIIFLDRMNREGRVAKKVAAKANKNFKLVERDKFHYLNILPRATDLVGSGSEYKHSHSIGLHEIIELNEYDGVFGGLFSDALLKGSRIQKTYTSIRFPFFPQSKDKKYSKHKVANSKVFSENILREVESRRLKRMNYMKTLRKESAEEWFELWPSSMNLNIPNFHANRRLFQSYEPFISKEVIKISASMPQNWKLNRKIFLKMAKPYLKATKWLSHSDGWYPYFSWYFNAPFRFISWSWRYLEIKTGLVKEKQRSWGDWDLIMKSKEWKMMLDELSVGKDELDTVIKNTSLKEIDFLLKKGQRINLLQVLYINKKNAEKTTK